jgi:hypothetical protein
MLKELEDYNWFPNWLRRFQMEFIGSIATWFALYKPIVPIANALLKAQNKCLIIDVCSGSGEPAIYLQNQLKSECTTQLSDKFPQKLNIHTPSITYLKESVDVIKISPQKKVLYTMYNAFHHFTKEEQIKILQQFSTSQASIVITEILTPSFFALLNVVVTGSIGQLLLTPFIRPFNVWRLFFTYIIPINIFTVVYDGVISVLKSKSAKQYKQIANNVVNKCYSIDVLCIRKWHGKIICIKAQPMYV